MRTQYIDIDSQRPDHLGRYGYHRDTTPDIDRIAGEGVRFTHSYCNSSPCVPARASFASGRFGINHGALTHWGLGSEFRPPWDGFRYWQDMPLFTRYLRNNGYKTVSFSSFVDRHQAFWFCGGWSEMHAPSLKMGAESADEVNLHCRPGCGSTAPKRITSCTCSTGTLTGITPLARSGSTSSPTGRYRSGRMNRP